MVKIKLFQHHGKDNQRNKITQNEIIGFIWFLGYKFYDEVHIPKELCNQLINSEIKEISNIKIY